MNKVILMGRLTRDPEIRHSQSNSITARYTLAVDRRFKTGEQEADFIPCVVFGKPAEFAEKYLRQGTKIAITGHLQTGSYTNKSGTKVYTTDVIVEDQEFAESKSTTSSNNTTNQESNFSPTPPPPSPTNTDGFLNIPDGIDEELPFI